MTRPRTYLISGATGSFGSALAKHLLTTTPHHVRLLSRDEHKQERMQAVFPPNERTTYILCDIKDYERMELAFHDADIVVHAAANKIVGQGERHAQEFVKTNIYGTLNVIKASIDNQVPKTLFISSDKAVSSVNFYGKTKAVAEGVFVSANQYGRGSKFACVRGGNVFGSRGSVIEKWLSANPITVTDLDTTRFHLPMDYWLDFCLKSIDNMHGGEIFIPKCEAWSLRNLSNAFCAVYSDKSVNVTSPRAGDKKHETLISAYESEHTVDLKWGYVIEPSVELRSVWDYQPHIGGKVDGEYGSDKVRQLAVDELRTLISHTL